MFPESDGSLADQEGLQILLRLDRDEHEKRERSADLGHGRLAVDSSTDNQVVTGSADSENTVDHDARPLCHLCSCYFETSKEFLRHYACTHLKSKLDDFLKGEDSTSCKLCGQTLSSKRDLYGHLVIDHRLFKSEIDGRAKTPSDGQPEQTAENEAKAAASHLNQDSISSEARDNATAEAGKSSRPDETLSESSVLPASQNSFRYRCLKCSTTTARYDGLVVHYVNVHFRQQLSDRFGLSSNATVCPSCGKTFKAIGTLLHHLAAFHGSMRDQIPSKSESSIGVQGCSLGFSCNLCPGKWSQWSDLVEHLVFVHHKKELLKRFSIAANEKICRLCQKSFCKQLQLLYHLTTAHDALGDRIPERPRKVGKKLKQKVSSY